MTAKFYAQGRNTRYPGKQAIINAIKDGNQPKLICCYDDEGQIVLVNPKTNEKAGCITPNPSYEDNYDILAACMDLNLDIDVTAVGLNGKNKHYIVEIVVQEVKI